MKIQLHFKQILHDLVHHSDGLEIEKIAVLYAVLPKFNSSVMLHRVE